MTKWNELEQLANKLNQVSDEMNLEILGIEAKLQSLGIGFETVISIFKSVDKDGTTHCLYLGYMKLGDKWHLCARLDKDEEWRALNHCARSTRIDALRNIELLLDKIKKNAEKGIPAIQDATQRARAFLSPLDEVNNEKTDQES